MREAVEAVREWFRAQGFLGRLVAEFMIVRYAHRFADGKWRIVVAIPWPVKEPMDWVDCVFWVEVVNGRGRVVPRVVLGKCGGEKE